MTTPPVTLHGVSVGSGIAAGPTVRMGRPPELPSERPVIDGDAEVELAGSALDTVSADLAGRSLEASDPTASAVLDAFSMIAADPELRDQVTELIAQRLDAPHALYGAFEGYREMLIGAGGYLAERAADLADIRDRVIAVVLGLPMPGIPDPGSPFVLVADDLSPADTATLDPSKVLALVTEHGGTTSHTAILARSLGLPCVVGCTGIMDVADGTLVGIDAGAGTVTVGIPESEVSAIAERAEALAASVKSVGGPGRTADGHAVALLHNIGSADDLGSLDDSFEGVGLFRTEFLFLDRHDRPSFDEQRRAYGAVLKAVDGRKVTLRTLDAGADKPLPFLDMQPEPNPALGIRGIRIGMRSVDVLDEQLAALAAAAADVPGSDVWAMAPMVATIAEARWFVERARSHGLTKAGVMIEIPAAALTAHAILAEVDFLSIGTNDLSQYTFAADRMQGGLAELLDPHQPALLQLVALCAAAGVAHGKPVGICGEAAADPRLAPVFAGMGITSLSMSANAIPAVRHELSRHTHAECVAMASSR